MTEAHVERERRLRLRQVLALEELVRQGGPAEIQEVLDSVRATHDAWRVAVHVSVHEGKKHLGTAHFVTDWHFHEVREGRADGLSVLVGDNEQQKSPAARTTNLSAKGACLHGTAVPGVDIRIGNRRGESTLVLPAFVDDPAELRQVEMTVADQCAELMGVAAHA